ncbi:hypothetical protein [Rhizobium sp. BK176]|uniref:hypothetical protein n=1 Tax=Rhizobium sp. BK176 TaxID=2587071 RepID=UPI0021682393|nr:hypothetical protein [Rhizobium sp. BK176]MCS4090062.1 hypothetical protein [Rhizobium sp. BK176]
MRSAVEFYGCIDREMEAHLVRMRTLLAAMPDNGDDLWSCHAATRGFRDHLGLPYEVKDGFFARKGTCHSWLTAGVGDRRVAIDILPMGAHGGPIVADIGRFAPWHDLYIEAQDHYAGKADKFLEEAALFREALLVAEKRLA